MRAESKVDASIILAQTDARSRRPNLDPARRSRSCSHLISLPDGSTVPYLQRSEFSQLEGPVVDIYYQ
jgi:hypothetical protein